MSGNTAEKMSVTVLRSTICIFFKKHQKIPKHYFCILATMCFKPQLIKKKNWTKNDFIMTLTSCLGNSSYYTFCTSAKIWSKIKSRQKG